MDLKLLLEYGNARVLDSIAGLDARTWEIGEACGYWSPKDVMAHLTSYEYFCVEVVSSLLGQTENPYMTRMATLGGDKFSQDEVAARQALPVEAILEEYQAVHEQLMGLLPQISAETMRQPGTLPWYGAPYALEDFLVYTAYGHKIEHCTQITVFKERHAV